MQINRLIDHTLLKPDATLAQIDKVIDEALDNHFYSVMVNPYWVAHVHEQVKGSDVLTACVIGFPLGANTTASKVAESREAIANGADELDMVINIGEMAGGREDVVAEDIRAVVETVHQAGKVVKVIIETALLSDEQIARASVLVADSGADFVKTSTGFASRGASVHDIEVIKEAVKGRIRIKAAGGIHTRQEAEALIKAGAERLGTSSSMAIIGKA
ncbi:deoxyribose-phosphate aldolase [Bifidobacterium sp. H1HS10N]|uniref:deoxyribose-phosphate aldolase n=1 Tax=Bifidobacterium kimbladii TaxID=1293826 RepID=UPI0028BEE4D8|nr:deoxyribose-phosphate aldolase [Bifidobacterium sp. H1HS10N]MDT7512812.1 deoxyribose-phosphate aldolase [Bifidobacterium sp. H1HS10N]